jgi:hypothetical protein
MMLPWYFVMAAMGLVWLARLIAALNIQPGKIYRYVVAGVVLGIVISNGFQSTVVFAKRFNDFQFESEALRLFQTDARLVSENPHDFKNYLVLTPTNYDMEWFYTIQDVYRVPESKAQFSRLIVESPEIPDTWLKRMKEEDNLIVLVPPFLSDDLRNALEPILKAQGKSPCNLDSQLQAWISPKYETLCVLTLNN